jgi:surface polysaccharide O-acyltransferase-like enzyme
MQWLLRRLSQNGQLMRWWRYEVVTSLLDKKSIASSKVSYHSLKLLLSSIAQNLKYCGRIHKTNFKTD